MADEIKYLDIRSIANKGMNWNVFVGARRIGKTYGILERFIDEQIHFLFMRRTVAEMNRAVSEDIFKTLNRDHDWDITVADYRTKDGVGIVYKTRDKDKVIGKVMPLSVVKSYRGVEYIDYEEGFLDEFMPEASAHTTELDGITCINAFETIMSNRELPPLCLPPMKMWLASNSIDLFDPILNALNLADPIAQMEIRNEKQRTMPQRSLYLYHGTEFSIAEAKKKTSLYKFIGEDTEEAQNMLYGKFKGNTVDALRKKIDFKHYQCIFTIDHQIYVYMSKVNVDWYICRTKQDTPYVYTKKMPLVIRRQYSPRYQLLKSINMVFYSDVNTMDFMDALLG